MVAQLMQTWYWVNQFMPRMTSNLLESMIINDVGNLTPLMSISKFQQTRLLLSMDPRDCTSMCFPKIEQEKLFWEAKLREIKEWEAPESNKITAGMLLTENIPMTISGFS